MSAKETEKTTKIMKWDNEMGRRVGRGVRNVRERMSSESQQRRSQSNTEIFWAQSFLTKINL